MHFISVLEHIKIHINIAPTCFGLQPSSGSLHMSLARVTFTKIGKSTSLWTVQLCGSMLYQVHGGVRACVCVCVCCVVSLCTAHTPPWT